MLYNNWKEKYIFLKTNNFKLILEKENSENILKKVKVINTKGIFLTGINELININDLFKYEYLGQYGEIKSIKKCFIKDNKQKKTYSVFVNFKTKLEASIAIKCLNNNLLHEKVMKCSFSSNKICIKKFISDKCINKDCFYYHKNLNKNNSITKIMETTNQKIMDYFNIYSLKILRKNIENLIMKIKQSKIKKITIFPSFNQELNKFFKKEFLQSTKETKNLESKILNDYIKSLKEFKNITSIKEF